MKHDPTNAGKLDALSYVEVVRGKRYDRISKFENHVDESILPTTTK
jgi:hypothetical protein